MTSPRGKIGIAFGAFALATLARSAESDAAPPPPNGAAPLAPYAVTDTFVGQFTVQIDSTPSQRLWLISVRENPNAPIAPRYTGAGIKSGDEIVSIFGRSVAEMKPGEAGKLIFEPVSRGRSRTIEIEVNARGEKINRKATLRFVPAPPGTKPDYSDPETAKSHGLPPSRK